MSRAQLTYFYLSPHCLSRIIESSNASNKNIVQNSLAKPGGSFVGRRDEKRILVEFFGTAHFFDEHFRVFERALSKKRQ